MDPLQNENAKTNRGQELCQENDRVFGAGERASVRERCLSRGPLSFVELVLFY